MTIVSYFVASNASGDSFQQGITFILMMAYTVFMIAVHYMDTNKKDNTND